MTTSEDHVVRLQKRIAELEGEVAGLEKRLAVYDEQRATYSMIALEHGTEILEQVFYVAIEGGRILALDTNIGTARSRATRAASQRGGVPLVLSFKVLPIELTEKVGKKWPQKKAAKKS